MIEVTLGYLLHNADWDRACDVLGLNPWCINEGADRDSTVSITFEQAQKIGLVVRLSEGKKCSCGRKMSTPLCPVCDNDE